MAHQDLEFESSVDEAVDPLELNIETLHDLDSTDADMVRGGGVGVVNPIQNQTIRMSGTSLANPSVGFQAAGGR